MTPFEVAATIILVPALIGLAAMQIAHHRWCRARDRDEA